MRRSQATALIALVALGVMPPTLAGAARFTDDSHHAYTVTLWGGAHEIHRALVVFRSTFLNCPGGGHIPSRKLGGYTFANLPVKGDRFHAAKTIYPGGEGEKITATIAGRIMSDGTIRGTTSGEIVLRKGSCWSGTSPTDRSVPFVAVELEAGVSTPG